MTGSPARTDRRPAVEDAAVFDRVVSRLERADVASPRAEARWLLEHAGSLSDGRGEAARRAILDGLVTRRARREPLQQIVGATWFRHLQLICRPGVFVPRPETEVVAGLAVEAASRHDEPVVVEPCTGGGAVALSVAAEVPGARVVAGDRDRRAVTLARRNLAELAAGRAGPDGLAAGTSCRIVRSDLLAGVDGRLRGRVDVLVANPPYLPARERTSWPPEVADHDPPAALVGGRDGLEVVVALLAAAVHWLAPGGAVVLEIDERRGDVAADAARRAGLTAVEVAGDLTGADRALLARAPGDGSP